jgi:hypothetical protein
MRTERQFLENLISSIDEPAGYPGVNVSRSRHRSRNGVLHLHDTANLLAGRGVQPAGISSMERQTLRLRWMRNASNCFDRCLFSLPLAAAIGLQAGKELQ